MMLEFEQIVKIAYWIILGILLLLIASRCIYFLKTRSKRIHVLNEKAIYKYFRYATILMFPIFLFGMISFVFVLQKGNMFASDWLKILLLLFLVLTILTEIYYNLSIVPRTINRILNIVVLFIIGTGGIYLTNLYLSANTHPSLDESVVIEVPFEGRWIASGAGATGLTNHHDRITSQKYAVDISKLGNNGKLFTGDGIEKEESYTYGAEVLSPVKGQVVWLIDSLADTPVRERDKLAGNHIVIKFQDSLFLALAHLQPYSIPNKIGDHVNVGDMVGKVGMSGNTDFCHLHIHIQDRPEYDIDNGKSYPIRFREFKRKRFMIWKKVKNEYLLSNDIVEK